MKKVNIILNIVELRKKNNFTQAGLANILGVSQQIVSKWEIGASYPSVEILIKLSQIFNCTIDELVKGGDNSNEQ